MGEFAAQVVGDRRKEGMLVGQLVVIKHEEQYSIARRDGKTSIAFPDVCKDAPYALVIEVSAQELGESPSAADMLALHFGQSLPAPADVAQGVQILLTSPSL